MQAGLPERLGLGRSMLAALVALSCGIGGGAGSTRAAEPAAVVKARPFDLGDVRLLDGPFQTALQRDARYLLEIDPQRLLHNFRVNAGRPSTAQPLGNWEAPKSELRGHLTGHYLSACALMFASTGDARFRERAALLVGELAQCQAALGESGYLSAFPEAFFDRLEAGQGVWAPYYTLHKILAGLLDAYTLCDIAQARAVAEKMGRWVIARTGRLSDQQVEALLQVEHGGINESLANLYGVTGDAAFLRCARRLCHQRVLEPLAAGEDKLAGLHANTQFPKVIGVARLYELTGQPQDRATSEFFWQRVVEHHSYATGSNSDHEAFGPPDRLNGRVSPFTAESCNTYNMLKLTRHIFAWNATAAAADYYERALYNHILATQDPDTGRMAYHIPVYGGWFMPYNTANDSAWCCTGTGFENHAKYGDSIYWHDEAGLFVNLFIASELTWRAKGVTLRQETRYPEEDTTRLVWGCRQPTALAVRIRHPAWATQGMTLTVNGAPVAHENRPGSFVTIARTWRDGDRVEVRLPMSLRLEPMPDNPTRAAIFYGPVILAGELGREGIQPPMPYAIKQSDFFKTPPPAMPLLVAGGRAVEHWVEKVPGAPLTFRTRGVGRPRDVRLVAFYALPPQRFSLYWDILTEDQWQQHQAAEERRAQRARELAARTIDAAGIGDPAAEQAHRLQAQDSHAGVFSNRPYRDARNGGWFSYELKLPAGRPALLLCTYWGSDAGPRAFDVLVNGVVVGSEKLNFNQPGEFFDAEYALPDDVTAGRKSITVKIQAQPGKIAGGVFDLRVVTADGKKPQTP